MLAICPAAVTFLFLSTVHHVVYPGYSLQSSETFRSETELVLNSLGQKGFFFWYKTMASIPSISLCFERLCEIFRLEESTFGIF